MSLLEIKNLKKGFDGLEVLKDISLIKGVPSLRNKGVRGDQYVTLVVQTPTGLNNEAKEALRHFDELTPFHWQSGPRSLQDER